jgi:hypothetical protein
VFRWRAGRDQKKKYLYEERITLWSAKSSDKAVELAEREAKRYAKDRSGQFAGLSQGFWLFEELVLPQQGVEVFSLLRDSDLDTSQYLDAFFDTGGEHQRDYKAEPSSGANAASPRRSL